MKILMLLLLLTHALCSSSQTYHTKGSFIIAAVCKDGIVMGSDSRITLSKNNKRIGYTDSIQKIFPGKNYAIGLMGSANVDTFNISYLTSRFVDSMPSVKEDVSYVWALWLEFIQKRLPNSMVDLDGMAIFIAGYRKSMPYLYYNYRNGTMGIVRKDRFVELDSTMFGSRYNKQLSCKKAKPLIQEAIYEYAKRKNNLTIGGPIYFIKISKKNRVKWFKEKPPKEYTSVQEIENHIFQKGSTW